MRNITLMCLAIVGGLLAPQGASAQASQPSLMDSFRIGSGGGALCQAQAKSSDLAFEGMFDRSWALVCRDAEQPIGQIFALRDGTSSFDERLNRARGRSSNCGEWVEAAITDLSQVSKKTCDGGYVIYRHQAGKNSYFAQGLSAYDSALQLGLRTVIADKLLPGKLDIATTGNGDDAAFARTQAATLNAQAALAEGYRRNNSGNYTEAAQFFDTLQHQFDTLQHQTADKQMSASDETAVQRQQRLHEYVINRALQLSNLGEFDQAEALFAEASKIPVTDRVQLRLRRNFEAMHLMNKGDLGPALAILERPVGLVDQASIDNGQGAEIGEQVAAEFNASSPAASNLGVKQETKLTADERAAIIDAQATQLRGTLFRLQGDSKAARRYMEQALRDAIAIRDGRVTSIARLRAQIMTEMALADETNGDFASARGLMQSALEMLETTYPETNAVNSVRARYASFLARRGEKVAALDMFKKVITSTTASQSSIAGIGNQIKPYFDLLSEGMPQNSAYADDMFLAAQALLRPGAADSVELLSRELSAGDGDAARLFRQSVTLARDIERGRIELARLTKLAQVNKSDAPLVVIQQDDLNLLAQQQTDTLVALAAYPQFRAVSKKTLSLADLRGSLKPGEAYFKMLVAGDAVYGMYVDAQMATGYALPISASQLATEVANLRETISTWENDQATTYAFDVPLARKLYLDLFSPVSGPLSQTKHLIFEPDGAMLQLPVNLLVADQASADAYAARIQDPSADEFDFRGVEWLGRRTAVSTAISARSFREARLAPKSSAQKQYLGYGNNSPVFAQVVPAQSKASAFDPLDCNWPLANWNRPIDPAELNSAANFVGSGGASVLTGEKFTDAAIKSKADLNNFRIVHFATHGFVTAPRAGCPARPSLLTSIGGADSDGLLSFSEIFDLKMDADVVILSACDTAGQASSAATREAGLGSGGGTSLDGLVRAFIGAGGRSVIASHWPAPDEYNATAQLISGLFQARGLSVAEAMQKAQIGLMDDAATSHPYYWSGFAIIGDGARPFLSGI